MSGVGEAIAIVSCIAGLIQAWDAGGRVIQSIKQRREAHRAQPLPSILEKSVALGKQQLQNLEAEGRERLGEKFDEGDAIVIGALKDVTIATQQAYLEGLAAAREDDNITDFTATIRACDNARSNALIILHSYILRKEQDEKKEKALLNVVEPVQSPSHTVFELAPQLTANSPSTIATPSVPSWRRNTEVTSHPTPPGNASKKRGRLNFLRRHASEPSQPLPTPQVADSQASHAEGVRSFSNGTIASKPNIRSIISSPKDFGERISSVSSGDSVSGFDSPTFPEPPSLQSPSRRSTRSTSITDISTLSVIAKYGGCCKYAHDLRDGVEKALRLQNLYMNHNCVYGCSSVKCKFQVPAVAVKGVFHMNDKIQRHLGISFRWLFLAKSHVAQPEFTKKPPYRCLICIMLREDAPKIYYGHEELMEHIAGHQGSYCRGRPLEGPLKFSNEGVSIDDNFDLYMPPMSTTPSSPTSTIEKSLYSISENVMHTLEPKMEVATSRITVMSSDLDELSLDSNPWTETYSH